MAVTLLLATASRAESSSFMPCRVTCTGRVFTLVAADGYSPKVVDVVLPTTGTAGVDVRLDPAVAQFKERLIGTPSRGPRGPRTFRTQSQPPNRTSSTAGCRA